MAAQKWLGLSFKLCDISILQRPGSCTTSFATSAHYLASLA